ncbi:MAG: aspartyl protease family protein [Capsulimonadales bacterium]|nr:aspartyl protease family protein [Capsulimonadales bacterium]
MYTIIFLRTSLLILALCAIVARVVAEPVHPDGKRSIVTAPQEGETLARLQNRQVATIPFTNVKHTEQMLVRATLDNTFSVTLLVDTGAPNICLFHSVTKKYPNLRFQPSQPSEGVKLKQGVCTFEDITIGNLQTFGEAVLLKPNLADKVVSEYFDGLLGGNVLEDHAVLINYDRKEIVVILEGNLTKQEVELLGFRGDTCKPQALLKTKKPGSGYYVNARLFGEQNVRLLLDTGISEVTVSERSVSGRSLKYGATSKSSIGFRSPELFRETRMSVALGNNRVDDLKCDVGNLTNTLAGSDELDGLLGVNFLSHFTVLMDFPAGKIYLRPRESEKARP